MSDYLEKAVEESNRLGTPISYIDSLVITLGLQNNATVLTTDGYIKEIKIIKTIKFDY